MNNTGKLAGLTIFITGASRGIGRSIAMRAAIDGANIVLASKCDNPNDIRKSSLYTTAEEIESVGGKSLPCIVDVRRENEVRSAVKKAVDTFGGIDIVVNNASAISLSGVVMTDIKRHDLMQDINTRGTFLVSKECLPHLKRSSHAHILNIAPPICMHPSWFKNHVAYSFAKHGFSMCAFGMAAEFKKYKIGVNALWPQMAVFTSAVEAITGTESFNYSRKPEIMGDAAYAVLIRDPRHCTGNFYLDEQLLNAVGISDLTCYANNPKYADQLVTLEEWIEGIASKQTNSYDELLQMKI